VEVGPLDVHDGGELAHVGVVPRGGPAGAVDGVYLDDGQGTEPRLLVVDVVEPVGGAVLLGPGVHRVRGEVAHDPGEADAGAVVGVRRVDVQRPEAPGGGLRQS